MTVAATLFPRWPQSIGALLRSKALAHSQCRVFGMQQRVDLDALAAKLGGAATLIELSDRCSVVACDGSSFSMAARTYGRQWITLGQLDGNEERAHHPLNAQSLLTTGKVGTDRRP